MSVSLIRFTPVYGVSEVGPLCYLLELDDFTILLDCGWDEGFDLKTIRALHKVLSRVDAVLLSHPDVTHLGALPYAVGKLGLTAPVYSTLPVWKMGQLTMYDFIESRLSGEEFDLFTLDDVDKAFENITQLKYSQHQMLGSAGIRITPYCAGHLIGGTIWRITKDTDEIVYAVDYNHRNDRHLNKAVLQTLQRPSLLITNAVPTPKVAQVGRKARDSQLIDKVMGTLRNRGNVLMPVDTAGRVLELLLLLDQHWTQHKLSNMSLAFLCHMSWNTVESAKSQIEWLSDSLSKTFYMNRENAYALKYVQLCYTREQLAALPKPMVVLATTPDLDTSFAQELLVETAPHPNNLILFTHTPRAMSSAAALLFTPTPPAITLKVYKRVPLTGQALKEHEERLRRQEQRENRRRHQEVALAAGELEDEVGATGREMSKTGLYSFSTGRFPMFNHTERHIVYDDYGEVIDTSIFSKDDELGGLGIPGFSAVGARAIKEEVAKEVPTKSTVSEVKVIVKAEVAQVDFTATSDVASAKNILTHVSPRKLILIHGAFEAKEALKEHVVKVCGAEVFIPHVGECVNVSSDTNAYKVKLSNDLMATTDLVPVGASGAAVTYVDAEVGLDNEGDDVMVDAGTGDAVIPTLVPTATPQGHPAVLVGEVKLSDLKLKLVAAGFKAEFIAGVLVVNDQVLVKKVGPQQLCLDGVLGSDFLRVREALYGQYAPPMNATQQA